MALFPTGDLETTTTDTWQVAFNDQSWLLAAMQGALTLLCDPDNWEQMGDVTPDDAAQRAFEIIDSLTFIP